MTNKTNQKDFDQAINFSSLTALKIFNAVNAGLELGLATLLTTAASVSFSDEML